MKKLLCQLLMCFIGFIPVVQAAETLIIDNKHSYVLWKIKHLGFSTQSGKWYVNGSLMLDKDKPENSKVDVTIKIADIVTGIPEMDQHLMGKLFFDVAQYPTAHFVSNKVEVTGKDTAKVEGTLTLHGVSRPVTLMVTLNKVGQNPITDRTTVGFNATTEIKRSDFGIKGFLPQVGDEVQLDISAEAYLENPKQ